MEVSLERLLKQLYSLEARENLIVTVAGEMSLPKKEKLFRQLIWLG